MSDRWSNQQDASEIIHAIGEIAERVRLLGPISGDEERDMLLRENDLWAAIRHVKTTKENAA